MTKKANLKKKSLCEKSMQMVVSIIKLSSLSLASISLGTAVGLPLPDRNRPGRKILPAFYQLHGNQRSQEPDSDSISYSYLMDPVEGESSSYLISEINDTEGRFSDYIHRFHEKNRNSLNGPVTDVRASDFIQRFHDKNRLDYITAAKGLPFLLPPPTSSSQVASLHV